VGKLNSPSPKEAKRVTKERKREGGEERQKKYDTRKMKLKKNPPIGTMKKNKRISPTLEGRGHLVHPSKRVI
jgi:hypothetical protein